MKLFLFMSWVIQIQGLLERPRRIQQMGSFEVVDDDAMNKEEREYHDDSSYFEESDFWARVLQGGPTSLDPITLDNDLSFEPNELSFDPIPLDNDLSFTENDLDDEFNLTDPPSVMPTIMQSEKPSLLPSKLPSYTPSQQPTHIILNGDSAFDVPEGHCGKGGKGGKGRKTSASPGGKKGSLAPGSCGKKSSSPGKAGSKASSGGKKGTNLPTSSPGVATTLDLEDDFVIEGGTQKDHHQSGSNDPPVPLDEDFDIVLSSTKASKSPGKGGKRGSASPSLSTQPSASTALDLEDDFEQVGKGKSMTPGYIKTSKAPSSTVKRKTSKAPAGKGGKAKRV